MQSSVNLLVLSTCLVIGRGQQRSTPPRSRSIHINCEKHDQSIQQSGSSLEFTNPDLLVLEGCSAEDIEYWLGYLENRFTSFFTLWLKEVRGPVRKTATSRSGGSSSCTGAIRKGLAKLKISGTEFKHGEPEILANLMHCTAVRSLEITENLVGYFGRIPGNSITVVNASNSNVKELPDSFLSDVKQLKQLDLSRNKLVKIPNGVFKSNRRLEVLDISRNSISFINRQSFLGLRHLRRLDLSSNDIASMWLEGDVFTHLSTLRFLNISRNRLTELDNGLLTSLPSLAILDLSWNQLGRLPRLAFQNQSSLQYLSLAHNSISHIDFEAFAGLSSALNVLKLDHNQLKTIHQDTFSSLGGLHTLDLYRNYLEAIPEAVGRLRELGELNLGENEIEELRTDSIPEGSKLKKLVLLGNTIQSILPEAFNNTPELETLDLSGNMISHLQQNNFAPLASLKFLSLASNSLTDINGLFTSQNQLLVLNVSGNEIKWFDMAFFPRGLKHLEIQDNHIEELGNYYKLLDGFNLTYLDASSNRISKLGQYTFVESLEVLNLSSNNISDLGTGSFAGLKRLQTVDLRNNSLRTVPRNSLKINPIAESLPTFFLSRNPLVCDCELEWLSSYTWDSTLSSSSSSYLMSGPLIPHIPDYAALHCSPPLWRQAPEPLRTVSADKFLCEYSSHCFSLCRCCTFLACDCRMKCPDPCNCYHDQAWNLNMIQCGSRNLTRVLREIPMDSTILYLDDNQLADLGTEKFLGRNRLSTLYLNGSRVEQVTNRTFLGLWGLKELHLEDNQLVSLPADAFQESGELEQLYLHRNLISHVDNGTFAQLTRLRILTLHANRLVALQMDVVATLQSLESITLRKNPWLCSCELSVMFTRVSETVNQRVNMISCLDAEQREHNAITFHSSCKDLDVQAVSAKASSSPFFILLLCSTTGILILLSVSVFLVIKRNSITRWIYAKEDTGKVAAEHQTQYSPMIKVPPPMMEQMKGNNSLGSIGSVPPGLLEYSTYLHYCLADDSYVRQVLSPKLKAMDPKHKLCLHHRDLPQSCTVGQAISQAVANSRCLLIVASPSYFLSSIPSYELQMILSEVLPRYTSYPVVVAVLQTTVAEIQARFSQLAGCQTDTWTFLEVEDLLFFDRVARLVLMRGGGGSGSGGTEVHSDSSSCSTKSTTASTLPARVSSTSPRVISNPLERFHHHQVPPGDSIYSTVMDPEDDDEEEGDHTYQTVYADQTLYIDKNLDLVKSKARFRTLQ